MKKRLLLIILFSVSFVPSAFAYGEVQDGVAAFFKSDARLGQMSSNASYAGTTRCGLQDTDFEPREPGNRGNPGSGSASMAELAKNP